MHDFYRKGHTSQLQRQQFQSEHFPEMVLSPQEATRLFTANQIDYVPLDEVGGRVAATMALVYPPGIGVVVPGERWDERAAPMIAYLKLFEESYAQFPGFTNEIQGLYPEKGQRRPRVPLHVRHQGIADETAATCGRYSGGG